MAKTNISPKWHAHLLNVTTSMDFRTILAITVGCVALYLFFLRISGTSLRKFQTSNSKELIIITGGSGGIGKQLSKDLASEKAKVLILDTKRPCFDLPENIHFYEVDITSAEAISKVGSEIRKAFGNPTIIVNNAGIFHHGPILEKSEKEIQETFKVNTLSHFFLIQEFLPSMVRLNRGHVITVASMATYVTVGEMVDYCCSKASALSFHEGLRQELDLFYNAPNVKTSIIHPLWVRTPMIDGFTRYQSHFGQQIMDPKEVSEAIIDQITSERSGQIFLPRRLVIVGFLRSLPHWLQNSIRASFSRIVWKVRNVRLADEDHTRGKLSKANDKTFG
ncbi:hypothetical protein N7462_002027 [Penicillium macrosclerotiorum]|uniref:uncharacterized protein n=1 Tax=Penicillium macrosclerotiorum TaxID=303699 RepID=UPI0025474EBD|nr:uncharacterized protein N7462_002027 [Penicillium macrosclerotiorum]KAJ5692604.1 hypothetical protein N7462_002027 [Penicillium macrosclerotiorum]